MATLWHASKRDGVRERETAERERESETLLLSWGRHSVSDDAAGHRLIANKFFNTMLYNFGLFA